MNNYPKVLIISHNVLEETNNIGKTLISLFKGWPTDKLCQIYLRSEEPSLTHCDNCFRITDREIINSYFQGKKVVGTPFTKGKDAVTGLKNSSEADQSFYNIGNKRIPIISLFRDLLWKRKSWKNEALKKWLTEQKPDVVLFVPNDYELIYPIASYASSFLSIPIIPYYMDDAFYFGSFVSPIDFLRRIAIRKKGKEVIKNSEEIVTIGPKMSNVYSKRFNKKCIELMNSVQVNSTFAPQPSNEIFTISYVGNLHSNRWKPILKLANHIDSNNLNLTIKIYTGSVLRKKVLKCFNNTKSIELCGKVDPSEVAVVLEKSDALLFVESFDKKSVASTMYSLSTKIPEYLNSSRPVLAFGPMKVSSLEYLKENNLAIVCDSEKNILDSIKKIVNYQDWYDYVHIHSFVDENHNIIKNREKMKQIIFERTGWQK